MPIEITVTPSSTISIEMAQYGLRGEKGDVGSKNCENTNSFPSIPEDGDICIVKDINSGGLFIYNSSRTAENDGGIVFDGWVRLFTGVANVRWFGAKGDGVDDTTAIQNACDSPNTSAIYFPMGVYIVKTPILISRTLRCYGDGIDSTVILTNADIETFKISGAFNNIERITFTNYIATHSKMHIQSYSATAMHICKCSFNGADSLTATGSGVGFGNGTGGIGGSMGVIDECIFNHASIIVGTWDVHISNSWVWANTRTVGIHLLAGSGNTTMTSVDIVPPQRARVGAKSGIYAHGVVTQPILQGVYIDGSYANLDVGIGILFENGVLGAKINNLRANNMPSESVILDSIYHPSITNSTFLNGNKNGYGVSDIVLKNTYPGKTLEYPLISGNSFIQTGTVNGTLGYAIKVDTSTNVGINIVDNSIHQPGGGGGYLDQEIYIASIFANKQEGSLRGNQGTRNKFTCFVAVPFSIGDTYKWVALSTPMRITPRQDQIHITFEGETLHYIVSFLDIFHIQIQFTAAIKGGTMHIAMDLD